MNSHNINTVIKKAVSILIITSFLLSQTSSSGYARTTLFKTKSHAQRYLEDNEGKPLKELKLQPSTLAIPAKFGRIMQSYKGKKDGLVIHIQDRHADEVAQLNIANVIDVLAEGYGMNLLCLEGASAKLDTSYYDKFPQDEAKEKVTRFFVKKGLFTGPEYYKIINKDKKIFAYGVEDKKSYLANLSAYKENQPDKERIISYLKAVRRNLNILKRYIYSRPLKAIDKKQTAYKNKTMELGEFAPYIMNEANKKKIDVSKYPNVKKFSSLAAKEKKIDFKKAEKRRNEIVKLLGGLLDEKEMDRLLEKSLSYKLGKTSAHSYHTYLGSVIELHKDKIDLDSSKHFLAYIDYLRLSEEIDNLKLLDEIDEITIMVKSKYYRNETQGFLDKYATYIDLLDDLYNLMLTHKKLNQLKQAQKEIKISQVVSFIEKQSEKYGLNPAISVNAIDSISFMKAQEFYEQALKRDTALVNNTIRRMKLLGNDAAILITGGFHTEGIVNLLKQKELSYIVICPNIGDGDCEKLYQTLMQNKLPGAADILGVVTSMLALALKTGDASDPDFVAAMRELYAMALDGTKAYAQLTDKEKEPFRKHLAKMASVIIAAREANPGIAIAGFLIAIRPTINAANAEGSEKAFPKSPEAVALGLANRALGIKMSGRKIFARRPSNRKIEQAKQMADEILPAVIQFEEVKGRYPRTYGELTGTGEKAFPKQVATPNHDRKLITEELRKAYERFMEQIGNKEKGLRERINYRAEAIGRGEPPATINEITTEIAMKTAAAKVAFSHFVDAYNRAHPRTPLQRPTQKSAIGDHIKQAKRIMKEEGGAKSMPWIADRSKVLPKVPDVLLELKIALEGVTTRTKAQQAIQAVADNHKLAFDDITFLEELYNYNEAGYIVPYYRDFVLYGLKKPLALQMMLQQGFRRFSRLPPVLYIQLRDLPGHLV